MWRKKEREWNEGIWAAEEYKLEVCQEGKKYEVAATVNTVCVCVCMCVFGVTVFHCRSYRPH